MQAELIDQIARDLWERDKSRAMSDPWDGIPDQWKSSFRSDAKVLAPYIKSLTELAIQYRNDMRHPPAEDSRKRRIEWINSVIGNDL